MRTKQTVATWNSMNGQQTSDPAKLAHALVQLAGQDEPDSPPRHPHQGGRLRGTRIPRERSSGGQPIR